jgi:hypothetical protein
MLSTSTVSDVFQCLVNQLSSSRYVWKPAEKPTHPPGSTPVKCKRKMQQKVRAKAHTEREPPTPPTASMSQNVLGKRKTDSSEDEVDDRV